MSFSGLSPNALQLVRIDTDLLADVVFPTKCKWRPVAARGVVSNGARVFSRLYAAETHAPTTMAAPFWFRFCESLSQA